jgi:hypothetical protein
MFAVVKADQVTKILKGGEPYTDENGTQHPSNIFTHWSTSQLNAIGIYPLEEQYISIDPKTEKFTNSISYIINDTTVTKSKSKVDRDFNDVKTFEISSVNTAQNQILNSTDWYYIRKTDIGTAIPTNVQNYRDAVRTAGNNMTSGITNAADKAAFQELYPVWDDDGNLVSGILNVWPDPKDYNL